MKALAWLLVSVAAGAYGQPDRQRALRWTEDLQFLSSGMKAGGFRVAGGLATRGQKDFSVLYPDFDREIQSIEAGVPHMTDAEVLLRVMRLMASAHVAHNSVDTPIGMGFLHRLPVTFQWFADGLGVVAATPEYEAALGARVLSVGGLKPEQFLMQLEPYVSYENQAELRRKAAERMNARGVLEHLKLVTARETVELELENAGAQNLQLSLPFVLANVEKIGAVDRMPSPPLYRSHPREFYWHQFIPSSGTLFIQYNRCENSRNLPFAEFTRKVLADADAHSIKRVVIDLRWNGGGNSRVIGPLIGGLVSRRKVLGPVLVLIGPATFSSAVDNARELQRALSARLVGEPSGGMPGGYGEVATLTLPNSKLVIRYTTKNFSTVDKTGRKALTPDVSVPLTLSDWVAGRDPVLDTAIQAQ
jgi:hypothetical protein